MNTPAPVIHEYVIVEKKLENISFTNDLIELIIGELKNTEFHEPSLS
jgi:hypothetical protein